MSDCTVACSFPEEPQINVQTLKFSQCEFQEAAIIYVVIIFCSRFIPSRSSPALRLNFNMVQVKPAKVLKELINV